MRNVSDKNYREIKKHKSYVQQIPPPPKNVPFTRYVEKVSTSRQATDDNTIWSVRFACRVTKPRIQTHVQNIQYLLLFPRQQWSRERASMLSYNTLPVLLLYTFN
jgi:hypothetical protein